MKSTIAVLLLACTLAGCAFGMSAGRFRPATSPAGVQTNVQTSGADFTGELLEVREAGLVVLTSAAIWKTGSSRDQKAERLLRLVPFNAIIRARFDQLGDVEIAAKRGPSAPVRERLTLVCRFPYGMTSAIESELLKASGQSAMGGINQ